MHTDRLTLIGYWAGPDTTGDWPSPEDFVDPTWDEDERSLVVFYLRQGHVVRGCMGWSPCRLCGRNNGDLELTDGTYVWPSGLVHYVEDHGVCLPQPFVAHAEKRTDRLEEAEYDENWWRSARPEPRISRQAADLPLPALVTGVEPELLLPADFDDHAWEVEAKGCYPAAKVRWSGQDFLVSFYDPVRLAQDIEADLEESGSVELERVVVVPRLTRDAMAAAACALRSNFFGVSA